MQAGRRSQEEQKAGESGLQFGIRSFTATYRVET